MSLRLKQSGFLKELGATFSLRSNLRYLVQPPKSRMKPIDGLRALAVLWIILMHCLWFQFPYLAREDFISLIEGSNRTILGGPYGVDVFFVISGFLIGLMLMKEYSRSGNINVKRFYWRRFLKLMPAYFVALGIYCVFVGINCDMIWTNIIYINNFIAGERQAMPWSWSLAIEEQFYFTFPVFLLAIFFPINKRWRLSLLFSLLALAFLIRALAVYRYQVYAPIPWSLGVEEERFLVWAEEVYIKPYTRYGCLLLGVIAAHLQLNFDLKALFRVHRKKALAGLFFSLLLSAWVVYAPVHEVHQRWQATSSFLFLTSYRYLLGAGVAYILLYSLYPSGWVSGGVHRFLAFKGWYPVAQLAYSAYLLHPIVFLVGFGALAPYGLSNVPQIVYYVAGPLLSLLAALVLYLTVERPFMNMRNLRPIERPKPQPRENVPSLERIPG